MADEQLHRLPAFDPVTGSELYVSEVKSDQSGIAMRGRFEVPRFARLNEEQSRFLEAFLRCRGVISSVEKELGLSYPTVRNRLDGVLAALDLTPAKHAEPMQNLDEKRKVLDELESGNITVEEAKVRIRGGA